MGRPRDLGIDAVKGGSKNVTFNFDDDPDLSAATITMTIKRNITDSTAVLTKYPDINESDSLDTGTIVFSFSETETAALDARTYKYEIKIVNGRETYIPIIGSFKLYSSVSHA
jgi:hypothetical protein